MKKYTTEIKWGLIFVAMMLAWMTFEKLAGLHDVHIDKHPIVTNLIMIPAFLVYYLALKEKRDKDYGGVMSWKQGFISGVIIGLVVMVITPLTQYITSTIITPDYFQNAIAYSVETNQSTLEAAEANFNLKNYIILSTISAPIMGAITAAIMALVVRRSAPKATPA
ncbi:MAG: DUF4199 domain-containing protein [Bacteroidota bacterium]